MITLISSLVISLFVATGPYRRSRERATRLAREYAGLTTVDSFSSFNNQDSYYSLSGRGENEREIHVLIPEKGGEILVFLAQDGISATEAGQLAQELGVHQVKRITFGIVDNQAIWEVYGDSHFFYFDFKTGEHLSEEDI